MDTLQEAWILIWDLLKTGETNRRHAFHSPTISTIHQGKPQARVVILRLADQNTEVLRFHTDFRSQKVTELKADPNIQWLFYSFPDKIQLRASAIATIHHQDPTALAAWDQAQLLSRRCYSQTQAPGTISQTKTHGLPDHLVDREPTEEEAEPGYENFCVVETKIHEIDILNLAFNGHSRARFTKQDQTWTSTWLYP